MSTFVKLRQFFVCRRYHNFKSALRYSSIRSFCSAGIGTKDAKAPLQQPSFNTVPTCSNILEFNSNLRLMIYKKGSNINLSTVLAEIREMKLTPNMRTYKILVQRACEDGDMKTASALLQEMKQAGFVPDHIICGSILHGYIKAGLPEEVEATKQVMQEVGMWPSISAYINIAYAKADLGDALGLLQVFEDAEEVCRARLTPDLVVRMFLRLVLGSRSVDPEVADKLLSRLPEHPTEATIAIVRKRLPDLWRNRWAARLLVDKLGKQYFDETALQRINYQTSSSATSRMPVRQQVLSQPTFELAREIVMGLGTAHPAYRWELYTALCAKAIQLGSAKDVYNAVDLAHLGRRHILMFTAVPGLLSLGQQPQEIVSTLRERDLNQAAAASLVLHALATDDLNQARIWVDQFQSSLPFVWPVNLPRNFLPRVVEQVVVSSLDQDGTGRELVRVLLQAVGQESTTNLCRVLIRLGRRLEKKEQFQRAVVQELIAQNVGFSNYALWEPLLEEVGMKEEVSQFRSISLKPNQTSSSNTRPEATFSSPSSTAVPTDRERPKDDLWNKRSQLLQLVKMGDIQGAVRLVSIMPLIPWYESSISFIPYILNRDDANLAQVESLFWALKSSSYQFPSIVHCLRLIADAYLNKKDVAGLICFYQKILAKIPSMGKIFLEERYVDAFIKNGKMDIVDKMLEKASDADFIFVSLQLKGLLSTSEEKVVEDKIFELLKSRLEDQGLTSKITKLKALFQKLRIEHKLKEASQIYAVICRMGSIPLSSFTQKLAIAHVVTNSASPMPQLLIDNLMIESVTDATLVTNWIARWRVTLDTTDIKTLADLLVTRFPGFTEKHWIGISQMMYYHVKQSNDHDLKISLARQLANDGHASIVRDWLSVIRRGRPLTDVLLGVLTSDWKPEAWLLDKLREKPELLYSILLNNGLNTLHPQQRNRVFSVALSLGMQAAVQLAPAFNTTSTEDKTNTQLPTTLATNIPAADLIETLANFVNVKHDLLNPCSQLVSSKWPDQLDIFVNRVVSLQFNRGFQVPDLVYKVVHSPGFKRDSMTLEIRAFARGICSYIQSGALGNMVTGMDLVGSLLQDESLTEQLRRSVLANRTENIVSTLRRVESDAPQLLSKVALGTVAAMWTYRTRGDFFKLLNTVAAEGHWHLLDVIATASRPVLHDWQTDAFVSLSRMQRGERVTWMESALVSYYDLWDRVPYQISVGRGVATLQHRE